MCSMVSGIVPATTIQMDIYWKEMDGDSEWVSCLYCLSISYMAFKIFQTFFFFLSFESCTAAIMTFYFSSNGFCSWLLYNHLFN